MSISRAGGPHSIYFSYVRVGLAATGLMAVAIPVVCALGPLPVDWPVVWTAFGVALAVAAGVTALPWRQLASRRAGQLVLYAWTVVDVGVIGAVVGATGGAQSWFWVVFVLTTVFFAVGYPLTGQLYLLVWTLVAYLAGVAAGSGSVVTTLDLWHVTVIVAAFALASFPAVELRRQTGEHERARQEAHQLAVRLEERETWWRSLIEHATDPIVVFDGHRNVVFASPAFEALLGYHPDETRGTDLSAVVHPEDLDDVQVAAAVVGVGRPRSETTCRVRRKDGEWRHVEVSFAAVAVGAPAGSVVANVHDVTKRVQAEAALAHQASHDPLTGLSNSRAFYHAFGVSLAMARRQGNPMALLVADLDRFKEANDTFGHAFGDQVLIGVARRLEWTLRDADVIARLGGDEFTAVLTTGADPVGAMAAARRVWESLRATMVVGEHSVELAVSIGVACFPEHGENPDALLYAADHAMYRAKRVGGGVLLFSAGEAPDPASGAVA